MTPTLTFPKISKFPYLIFIWWLKLFRTIPICLIHGKLKMIKTTFTLCRKAIFYPLYFSGNKFSLFKKCLEMIFKKETINEIVFVTVNLFYHNSTNITAIFWRQKWYFIENDRPLAALSWLCSSEGTPSYLTQFLLLPPLVQQLAC